MAKITVDFGDNFPIAITVTKTKNQISALTFFTASLNKSL